jgi:hypothetical protein
MPFKTCLIQPYARILKNKKRNAKNYPFWPALVTKLQVEGYELTQLHCENEVRINKLPIFEGKLSEVEKALANFDFFIAVDSFLPHMARIQNKNGVVLWGKSDPLLFGYPENLNLFGGREHMTRPQFLPWEEEPHDVKVFMKVDEVVKAVKDRFPVEG